MSIAQSNKVLNAIKIQLASPQQPMLQHGSLIVLLELSIFRSVAQVLLGMFLHIPQSVLPVMLRSRPECSLPGSSLLTQSESQKRKSTSLCPRWLDKAPNLNTYLMA